MQARIPPHHRKGAQFSVRQQNEDGRKAGRDPVEEIVKPRGGPAEPAVFPVSVSDHRIGGVHSLVCDCPRQPQQQIPERRRNDAIGEILRRAFDGGAGDGGFVHILRIAAHDPRHGQARAFKGLRQRTGNLLHMLHQAAVGEEDGQKGDLEKREIGNGMDGEAGGHGAGDKDDNGKHALFPPHRRMIERHIEPADNPPHQHRRMRPAAPEPCRLAEYRIKKQSNEKDQGVAQSAPSNLRQPSLLPGKPRRSQLRDQGKIRLQIRARASLSCH